MKHLKQLKFNIMLCCTVLRM